MSRPTLKRVLRGSAALTLVMTVVSTGEVAAQSEPVALTLDEVIRRTLLNSPQVVQAEGAVQTAGASELSAVGAFLPNLNVSSGAALSSTQRFDPNTNTNVTGSSDSYNAGISTGMDLFTGGRRGAQLTQARAETRASEASLVQQRYTVTRNAKAAYFDVARADDLIRSAEARLQRAEEGLAAANLRSQAGSATRSDVLRAELERTNARQGLLQANNQKRAAMYALGRLVAIDGPVDVAGEQSLDAEPLALSPDELLQLALTAAPAVITARNSQWTACATSSHCWVKWTSAGSTWAAVSTCTRCPSSHRCSSARTTWACGSVCTPAKSAARRTCTTPCSCVRSASATAFAPPWTPC